MHLGNHSSISWSFWIIAYSTSICFSWSSIIFMFRSQAFLSSLFLD